jgi:hypothetical protein
MDNNLAAFQEFRVNKKETLDGVNNLLIETIRTKRKINKLHKLYSEKLLKLNELSKIIRADAVNVRII